MFFDNCLSTRQNRQLKTPRLGDISNPGDASSKTTATSFDRVLSTTENGSTGETDELQKRFLDAKAACSGGDSGSTVTEAPAVSSSAYKATMAFAAFISTTVMVVLV